MVMIKLEKDLKLFEYYYNYSQLFSYITTIIKHNNTHIN